MKTQLKAPLKAQQLISEKELHRRGWKYVSIFGKCVIYTREESSVLWNLMLNKVILVIDDLNSLI